MIQTERLSLRRWRPADVDVLDRIHADPEVAYWLGGPGLMIPAATAIARMEAHIDEHGFGLWAIERRDDGALIGVAGLRRVLWPDFPMSPSVEIGWRLARAAWGSGYVTEAARAALGDGFERVGLEEIRSWTSAPNLRSQAVMDRIGMIRTPELDFDHPQLEDGHPLRRHVVWVAGRP